MSTFWRLHLFILAAAFSSSVAHAGTVILTFVDPTRYEDIGINENSRQQALDNLRRLFDLLARRLPQDATLRVDVLDVDLAGKPLLPASLRGRYDVRVNSAIDWPRMHLRYVLELNSAARRTGEEWIKGQKNARFLDRDMDAERRMLMQWFDQSIVGEVRAHQ